MGVLNVVGIAEMINPVGAIRVECCVGIAGTPHPEFPEKLGVWG